MSYLRRFAMFWYDFLIGDKWELFVGPIVALVVVGVAVNMGLDSAIAGPLLFVLVAVVGGLSLVRSLRSAAAP